MFKCDICSKKFRNRKNLNKHLKENHLLTASLTSHDMAMIKEKSDILPKQIPVNIKNINTIEIGQSKICEDLSDSKKLSKNLKAKKGERYSNVMTAKEDSSCRNVEMIEINKEKDKDHKSGIKTRLRNYQCTKTRKSADKNKSIKNFVCKFCSRDFITKYRLRKHLQQSHKNKSVKSQTQKQTSIMVEHSPKILEKRIHQCQFCKKKFSKKFTLAYHVDKLHQGDKSISFYREYINNAKVSSQYRVNSKHLLTTKAVACSSEESSEDLNVCNSELNFRKESSEDMIENNSEVNSHNDSSEDLNENSVVNSNKNNSEDLLLDNTEVYSRIENSKGLLLSDDSSSSDEATDHSTASFVVNKKVLANMTELEKDLIRQYGGCSTQKKKKKNRKRKIRKTRTIIVDTVKRTKVIEHPDVIIHDTISSLQKLKATPECDDDKSPIKAILLMKMLPQTNGDKILRAPILRVEKLNEYKIRIAIEKGNNIILNELSRIEIYATTANIEGEWVLIAELSTHKPPLIIHVIQKIKTRYFFSVRGIGYNSHYTIFSIPATW